MLISKDIESTMVSILTKELSGNLCLQLDLEPRDLGIPLSDLALQVFNLSVDGGIVRHLAGLGCGLGVPGELGNHWDRSHWLGSDWVLGAGRRRGLILARASGLGIAEGLRRALGRFWRRARRSHSNLWEPLLGDGSLPGGLDGAVGSFRGPHIVGSEGLGHVDLAR